MRDFLYDYLEIVVFVLLLISRLGDIISTYLITPKLKLEANPIVRKLGWRFAIVTVLACLLPFWNLDIAVAALVAFLMVSASNTAKIWAVRTMGEQEYHAMLIGLVKKGKLSHALMGTIASALFIILLGLVFLLFYPDPAEDWGFWLALGIIMYGLIAGFYGCLYFVKLFRKVKVASSSQCEASKAT